MRTIFVAIDGKQFDTKKACELYEKSLGKVVVKDIEEVINIVVKDFNFKDTVLDNLHFTARNLVQDFEAENGKIVDTFIYDNGHKINSNYLIQAIFDNNFNNIARQEYDILKNATDEKIRQLYSHAYNRGHSAGLDEVVYYFTEVVELIEDFNK